MNKSKNDDAWELIFEKYQILEKVLNEGYAIITSNVINEFREARLMTKFDHKSQLPKLFADNNLSILPASRGTYVIGDFEIFSRFSEDNIEIEKIKFPTFLESLNYKDITSEATAINCAFVSKILHNFTGEENLFPTVSGRMSSLSFDFKINSPKGFFKVEVKNSQVEIDGGYEGDNTLNLIEAKNYISDDFLVRQLYYPFKLWSGKIQKKVCPIFLTYSNGVFHLREFTFSDIDYYNSLVLVKQKKYIIQDETFNIEVLQNIIDKTEIINEPEIPFPQADSFERVINLCELLSQKEFISKEEITRNYDFEYRQTDYYANAGKYLGLVEIESGCGRCFLSKKGRQLFDLDFNERQREFISLIIKHKAFNQTLKLYLDRGDVPAKAEVVNIMQESMLYKIDSEETYQRRASTVISWISWILNQIEE